MGIKSCADVRSVELWGNEVSCEKTYGWPGWQHFVCVPEEHWMEKFSYKIGLWGLRKVGKPTHRISYLNKKRACVQWDLMFEWWLKNPWNDQGYNRII